MAKLPSWVADVKAIFDRYGVPPEIWLPIAAAEAPGLDPLAYNGKHPDDSYGLFQLNRKGGQGAGYSPEFLFDPVNNATIAVKYIAPAYHKYKDLALVAINSGHPGPVPTSDPRIRKIVGFQAAIKGKSFEDSVLALSQPGGPPIGNPPPDGGGGGGGGWPSIPGLPGLPSLPSFPTVDQAAQWLWDLFENLRQRVRDAIVNSAGQLAARFGGPVAFWAIGLTLVSWSLLALSIAGGLRAMRLQLKWAKVGTNFIPGGIGRGAGAATNVVSSVI